LPKNLLKRGSIEEIISSQKLIDEKIEKLSNKQPENLAAVNDGSIQYAPDDIGKISVDEIVDKLGHVEGSYVQFTVSYRQYIIEFQIRLPLPLPLTDDQLIRCV
jgi:hypothetical protein